MENHMLNGTALGNERRLVVTGLDTVPMECAASMSLCLYVNINLIQEALFLPWHRPYLILFEVNYCSTLTVLGKCVDMI